MLTALFYAMPSEIDSLIHGAAPTEVVNGVSFFSLRDDLIACCGGVGKVNAAMAAALLIERYHPDLIINAGVAGCFEEVPIGTLVLAEDFIQHDVDTTGVGDPIGLVSTVNKVSFPTADFDRAKAAMDKTGYPYRTGRVATGDWFALPGERVNFIRDTFSPLLCEMEGGAVAQVCYRCGVPMMAIKSVSDCLVVKQDYYFNFPMAMADLNKAVMAFVDALKEV